MAGLDHAAPFLVDADPDWPTLSVERNAGNPVRIPTERNYLITPDYAELPLSDGAGWAVVYREDAVVRPVVDRDYLDEELLHPLLSGAMSLFNLWHGRDTFHAGAFVLDGRAWAVLGDRGQGKSSMLGHLALAGLPVLSDDVVVENHGDVLAGPGFVDLRPDAARALDCGRDMGMLGARERFRLDLAQRPARAPLAGWLSLEWSDEPVPVLRPVPIEHRLPLLFGNRSVLLQPASPENFMRYAALPFFQLRRPKNWAVLPDVLRVLEESLPGPR